MSATLPDQQWEKRVSEEEVVALRKQVGPYLSATTNLDLAKKAMLLHDLLGARHCVKVAMEGIESLILAK